MNITMIEADPLSEPIARIVRAHLADMAPTAPEESRHALDASALVDPSVALFQVCVRESIIGMGGFKDLGDSVAELKSMRVSPEFRGRGLGRQLLDGLIDAATQRGFTLLCLETGTHDYFAAARRMYRSAGFTPCPPFGDYQLDGNSVYYRLQLA
ncbi:GNAT family N-acetyltransferase [Glutamicibacter nicotianae]